MARASRPRSGLKQRKIKRSFTKPRAKSKGRRTPRIAIRSSPSAAPNVHMFKRSYDHPFTIGVADSTNGVLMNTDNKWQIVQLHTQFAKLPEFTEFKTLFSEYKITSVTHKLVPYYGNNQLSQYTSSGPTINIPNFEVFCLPVNSSAREAKFHTKTAAEIDSYINQSQRKSNRIMPSRTQVYRTLHPKVVGYKGPLSKDGLNALMAMEAPTYLNTDPTALVTGGVDQTAVTHYGVTLLIRRVDGAALNSSPQAGMGFRMENDVFFKCRKVQ